MNNPGARIKSFLITVLFRASPGLRKLAQDRALIAAELETMRAERDALRERVRADLEAQLAAALAERNALREQVQAQAANQSVLTARVAELMTQVRTSERQHDSVEPTPGQPRPAGRPTGAPSRRAAKFVVFSNPRSGSTWLETTLGLLPDVHVDYELKWGITYASSEIHAVLDENSKTVSHLLEEMDSDAAVTGSKFVFDVFGLTPPDFRKLTNKIGPDVRIIHLTRNYRDIFLSIRRGFHHAPVRTGELSDRLRNALDSADIRHRPLSGALPVTPATCFKELSGLLDNDIHIHTLRAAGFPYLQVSYDEVGDRLAEVVAFAGSQADPKFIADALARPAVAKLPVVEGDKLVANLGELEPLFGSFETLRRHMIR